MSKKVGLPDSVKFRYDNHLVDEISTRAKTEIIRNIPVEKIIPNVMQPRKDMGNLSELSESVKVKGIIEPILVRRKDGKFEIIAGERRYKAAKLAGLKEVPCIEYNIPDNEALELSMIENIQRKDLNVFENAFSLKSLAEIYGYTHQEIAEKIGKSRVTITELIRLADLPQDIVNKCLELSINSKTFLSQLLKLRNKAEMMAVLEQYAEKPVSRDVVKNMRKVGEGKSGKRKAPLLKFNFSTDNKAIKINFNIKKDNFDKNELISILEKLISDIKHNKFKELK